MIRVDRTLIPTPSLLESSRVEEALGKAREHFRREDPKTAQQRFKFDSAIYRAPEVLDTLSSLFHDKCAFCETPVHPAASLTIVQHFRPTQDATDADGTVSRPHYWWLAYTWENLYLVCQRCAAASARTFPVIGRRLLVEAPLSDGHEQAVLVDPCADDPSEHLAFADDGNIVAATERGHTTIEVYRLNRRDLRAARAEAIAAALGVVRARLASGSGLRDVRALLDPSRSYAGAVTQAVQRLLSDLGREDLMLSPGPRRSRAVVGDLVRRGEAREVEPVAIEAIDIENFRGVAALRVDFPAFPSKGAPWTMLLGENGHGKTSVLQAIAIALMGEAERTRLNLQADELIHQEADSCAITIHLIDGRPRRLSMARHSGRWTVEGDDTPAALAAYGASRIPPIRRTAALPRISRKRPRIQSLFDPHARLTPLRAWATGLDRESFNYAARTLTSVTLEHDAHLEVEGEEIMLKRTRGSIPLDQLSDGYRATMVLAADVLRYFSLRYGDMESARGLVLIDELGAHLHPRWQMRVVEAFREAFPHLQFICTTHDPLCLRGLYDNEAVVLRRTPHGHIFHLADDELPPLSGLEVDELLTSEAFGLNSTLSPDLDDKLRRWQNLLAERREPSAAERAELEDLRKELGRARVLGATERERLALTAADEYIGLQRAEPNDVARRRLSDDVRQRLREAWRGDVG